MLGYWVVKYDARIDGIVDRVDYMDYEMSTD
jgi:hypothetical protein